jgi:hypothetical protein
MELDVESGGNTLISRKQLLHLLSPQPCHGLENPTTPIDETFSIFE